MLADHRLHLPGWWGKRQSLKVWPSPTFKNTEVEKPIKKLRERVVKRVGKVGNVVS